MKTKEFIKRVEDLGLSTSVNDKDISVLSDENYCIATVNLNNQYVVDTDYWRICRLSNSLKKDLFDVITEYAMTTPDERGEEKKYYLKHRWLRAENGSWVYLTLIERTNINSLILQGAKSDFLGNKSRFTLKEIEEIKEKYNTDLSDFVIWEVEE